MPVALPAIAVALAAIGTGVSTYAAIKQGNAADDAAKASANAERANAKAAQDAASLEAAQVRRKNLLRLGTQRANAAKSGVLIDGSSEDVIYDSAIQGELEALSTLYSGATQASYYGSRTKIERLSGKNAKSASRLQAGGTLIGGLGRTASSASDLPSMKRSNTAQTQPIG